MEASENRFSSRDSECSFRGVRSSSRCSDFVSGGERLDFSYRYPDFRSVIRYRCRCLEFTSGGKCSVFIFRYSDFIS